jgi:hypothetical protein
MVGSAKNEICFFRIPGFDFKRESPSPTPTALVKVAGGCMDAATIQTEYGNLTGLDWKWEALPHVEDSFLVAFPCEDELKRKSDMSKD